MDPMGIVMGSQSTPTNQRLFNKWCTAGCRIPVNGCAARWCSSRRSRRGGVAALGFTSLDELKMSPLSLALDHKGKQYIYLVGGFNPSEKY